MLKRERRENASYKWIYAYGNEGRKYHKKLMSNVYKRRLKFLKMADE